MARIRTIKPEFWTDEKVVSLPYESRLLFIGIWNFCDDAGLIWDEPGRIRLLIFPADGGLDIDAMLSGLANIGLIERLQHESGKGFIKITHWSQHQTICNPGKSRILNSPIESSRTLYVEREVERERDIGIKGVTTVTPGCQGLDESKDESGKASKHQRAFMEVWNRTKGVVLMRSWTNSRKEHLRNRLATTGWDWLAALSKFPLQCFLNRADTTWQPNVDWFLRPNTVTSILEGKYDFKPKSNGHAGKDYSIRRLSGGNDGLETIR